ncbi:uncharacterized protein LOC124288381 isoform X3 [Haliotis rubra]|uniref:uncharacterized protein LOC124288381 isoform X3 n=1 Tax=Haliotis rubra TaxID=36100 RepID=UPI001EE58A65|nr:uncharacterized protein LOC124288381 isoform X3 [Haliotis rubra]
MKFDDITVSENAVLEAPKIETVTFYAEHSQCESFFEFFKSAVANLLLWTRLLLASVNQGPSTLNPYLLKKVSGSCFHNATETASSSAAEAVCGAGKTLKLAEVGNPMPLVTREMIVDGHCMEDRWNSGTRVSFFCIRHCLMYPLDSTQDCTSAVIQSQYVCL